MAEIASCGGLLLLRRALEHARLERMALEQAVELGAVAAGESRGLGYVAAGYLQDSYQVVALEGLARLVERRERRVGDVERLAHQRLRDDLGRGERYRLLHHVQKLAHVAGPRRRDEQLHRLGRELQAAAAIALGELGEIVVGDERDVFAALGQRRNVELDDVQPVVEI